MKPERMEPEAVYNPEILCVPIPVAAQMLSATVRAVRELLWAKKIPFKKIGKRFVIPVEELRAFVRSETTAQPSRKKAA